MGACQGCPAWCLQNGAPQGARQIRILMPTQTPEMAERTVACSWCGRDLLKGSPNQKYHDLCVAPAQTMKQIHWQERQRLSLPYDDRKWTNGQMCAYARVWVDQALDDQLRRLSLRGI